MQGKLTKVKISGISVAVPERIEHNSDFAELMGERRLKKQIRITGVEKRHVPTKNQKTSDFLIVAAEQVLDKLGWSRDDIRYLIVVTQNPEFQMPATAMYIQKELNIGQDCLAFDVNLGCSGYVGGLQIMGGLLEASGGKGLLLVGDSEYRSEEDRKDPEYAKIIANDLLFGFAGSATAMEAGNDVIEYEQKTDGNRYEVIHRHAGEFTQMDGSAVFSFTMNEVAEQITGFVKRHNLSEHDVDYYVFHQAQKMIIESLADICEIPQEKVLSSLSEYGNTSGTSIPVTLCANIEQLQKQKSCQLLLSGFGVGLSWGTIYLTINPEVLLPIVETNHSHGGTEG